MPHYSSKAFFTQTFSIPPPTLTEKNLPDQVGKVYIVTGGYAGVGEQLAGILYQNGATVYVAGRSQAKAAKSIENLEKAFPSSKGKLEFLMVDFADLTSVKTSAELFMSRENRLDVLTNNAGVMFPPDGSKTKQGHELQFGTNCLGPFLFTKSLLPILTRTAATAPVGSVRVTWAGSLGIHVLSPQGGVMFTDGQPKIFKSSQTNYGETKAGNLYMASEFARRHSKDGLVSVCFNPGNLATELQRHSGGLANRMSKSVLHPAIFGAYTELYAGWSADITSANNGAYIMPWGRNGTALLRQDVKEALTPQAKSESIAERFWDWCEQETAQYS